MRLAAAVLAMCVVAAAQTGTLEIGYQHLYNLQFASAHGSFSTWMQAHPNDPLGPASDAAAHLFAELERMQVLEAQFYDRNATFLSGAPGSTDPAFVTDLAHSEALAAEALAKNPVDTNALYSEVLCHGLRADDLAIVHKRGWAAIEEMNRGRTVAERLLQLDPGYGDAYLALGIENYVLSQRAVPVRWMLRLSGAVTDKKAGITELRRTAAAGHMLRPFAEILLSIAALRDHQPATARGLLRQLAEEFPANPLFPRELARLGQGTATLDSLHSQVEFTLSALLHTVHGSFAVSRGRLQWDPASGAAGGAIVVAAASGDSGNKDRDRDMREKVLRAEEFPEIVFTPQRVAGDLTRVGESQVTVQGSLALAGVEHSLDLPLKVAVNGNRFSAHGEVAIPYVAWGLKNPSNLFLRVDKQVKLVLEAQGTISLPVAPGGGP